MIEPTVECFTPRYYSWLTLIVILIVLDVAGTPLGIAVFMRKFRQPVLANEKWTHQYFGVLFEVRRLAL